MVDPLQITQKGRHRRFKVCRKKGCVFNKNGQSPLAFGLRRVDCDDYSSYVFLSANFSPIEHDVIMFDLAVVINR